MANIPTHSAPVPRSASKGPTGNPPPDPESHLRVASRDSEGFLRRIPTEKVKNRSQFLGLQQRRVQLICSIYIYLFIYIYIRILFKMMFCKRIAFPMCTSTFWYQFWTHETLSCREEFHGQSQGASEDDFHI